MFDARALHAWLGNRDRFTTWMKDRIDEYGFEEGPRSLQWAKTDPKFLGGDKDGLAKLFLGSPNTSTLAIISRPGLLKLIARSNKPEAKRFDRWVRHEVLPQVMDNGAYIAPNANLETALEKAPTNTPTARLEMNRLVMSAIAALEEDNARLEAEVTAAAPKVAFVDSYVAAENLRTP